MMWIGRVGLLFVCFVSGCAQTTDKFEWQVIQSADARLRGLFPCEPKLAKKSFQDDPRPIHVFDFSCEKEGMRFLLSVKNHPNDFTSKTVDESFESNEFLMKNMFGSVESFDVRNGRTSNDFELRDYDLLVKGGGKIRSRIVVNEFATYQALVGLLPEKIKSSGQKKLDFVTVSERFIASVEILNK